MKDGGRWRARRDAGRADLKAARNAFELADPGDDLRLVVQGAILAAIAYANALLLKARGATNIGAHERLAETLEHALSSRVPRPQLEGLARLIKVKNESAYGVRPFSSRDAREALRRAQSFAEWAEIELARPD